MASWNLSCKNCQKSFVHSSIEVKEMSDYFLPEKPEFPEGGSDIECPNCGHVANYQRNDLTYSA